MRALLLVFLLTSCVAVNKTIVTFKGWSINDCIAMNSINGKPFYFYLKIKGFTKDGMPKGILYNIERKKFAQLHVVSDIIRYESVECPIFLEDDEK